MQYPPNLLAPGGRSAHNPRFLDYLVDTFKIYDGIFPIRQAWLAGQIGCCQNTVCRLIHAQIAAGNLERADIGDMPGHWYRLAGELAAYNYRKKSVERAQFGGEEPANV